MLLTKTFGKDSSPLVGAAEVPTCCTPSEESTVVYMHIVNVGKKAQLLAFLSIDLR